MDRPLIVVGGGAVGLACAYYLQRSGVDVVLLEAETVGAGASWGNAGWVTPALAAPLPAPGRIGFAIRSLFQPSSPFRLSPTAAPMMLGWLFKFAQRSNARDYVRGRHQMATFAEPTMTLFDELRADGVRFEMASNGLLFAALSRGAAEHELEILAPMRDHGYEIASEPLAFETVHQLAPALSERVHSGVLVREERHVNPRSLLVGLRARLDELRVKVLEGVAVEDFVVEGDRIVGLATSSGAIEASGAVLAAGAWTAALAAKLGDRVPLQAGKGYSFSVRLNGSPPAMPIYLVEAMVGCTPLDGRLRLAGTLDVSSVDRSTNWRRLDAMKRAAARYLGPADWTGTTEHWMGMRPITYDGLPVIGRLGAVRNAYVATGHQMLGITLAPATGAAIARLAAGDDPPELRPFSPDRFAKRRQVR